MIKCPLCDREGRKVFRGYCSRVHHRLDKKKSKKVTLPCNSCGKFVTKIPSAIYKTGNVYCKECKRAKGEQHYRWKEGIFITEHGYRLVLINGEYLREHRRIWEESNKACLLPWANNHIHHLDENKLNNDPNNLLLLSGEEHGRIHRLLETDPQEAILLLKKRASEQLFYPKELDSLVKDLRS